jgi:TonB family protein
VFRPTGASESQIEEARTLVPLLAAAAVDAVRQWAYDPPAAAPIAFPVEVTVGRPPAAMVPTEAQPIDTGALRVGGNIKPPTRVRSVAAVYPPDARDAKITGVVIIQIRIEGDGRVSDARVVRSVPALDQAALDAVRQWEFTPTLMNGNPVPIILTTTVNFTLK